MKAIILAACLGISSIAANEDINLVERYSVERWGEFDDLHFHSKTHAYKMYYQGRMDAYSDVLYFLQSLRDDKESTNQ